MHSVGKRGLFLKVRSWGCSFSDLFQKVSQSVRIRSQAGILCLLRTFFFTGALPPASLQDNPSVRVVQSICRCHKTFLPIRKEKESIHYATRSRRGLRAMSTASAPPPSVLSEGPPSGALEQIDLRNVYRSFSPELLSAPTSSSKLLH